MKKLLLILISLVSACAHVDKNDPLANSKKLISKGHQSLYANGAFQIPSTKVKIIPEGPGPIDLAFQLAGPKARESFLLALKDAKDSVVIVVEGTRASTKMAGQISEATNQYAADLLRSSKQSGIWVMDKSFSLGKDIVTKSWQLPESISAEMTAASERIDKESKIAGEDLRKSLKDGTSKFNKLLIKNANEFETESVTSAGKIKADGADEFVTAYLQLPQTLGKSIQDLKNKDEIKKFAKTHQEADENRKKSSQKMTMIIDGVAENYSENTSSSLKKASGNYSTDADEVGYTLATLRAVGWLLQGLFWDGGLKPIGKVASAGVGYLIINGVIYPGTLTVKQGLNVGEVLVEIGKTAGEMGYEIIAPTGEAAFSMVMAGTQWSTGKVVKGAVHATSKLASGASFVAEPVFEYTIKGSGLLASKTIRYIGIPLANVAVVTGGTIAGVVVGGQGAVSGSAVSLAGSAASGVTYAVGHAVAKSTAVLGTAGAVVLGSANAFYEVGKATLVPSAQVLTGGIVLSYGTLSQLGAHTILAVSDAAYLVLSLEGPSYVVYAIQGKLGKGKNLSTGSVIDLEAMQTNGEVIKKVPLSDVEIERVKKSMEREYSQP